MYRRVIGLEVGPDSIRAVQIHVGLTGKVVIERMIESKVTGGIDQNGKITNPELLGKQLKGLWKLGHLRTKRVSLGLGGTDVFVREFSVPEMKPEAISGALPALAEGSLPMPTTELFLDFYPSALGKIGDNRAISGLLLAATRNSTESLTSAIQSAGLSPDSVDLVPFALLRQLNAQKFKGQVVAIVHASAGYLNIVVAKDQVPIFIRMVPLPDLKSTTTEAHPDASHTSSSEVSALETDVAPVLEAAEPKTSEIMTVRGGELISSEFQEAALRELKDTLAYFGRNHPGNPVLTLITSGKGLDNSEWLTLLGQQIWLPSESHTLTERYKTKSGKVELVTVPTQFLVALALAKGVRRG